MHTGMLWFDNSQATLNRSPEIDVMSNKLIDWLRAGHRTENTPARLINNLHYSFGYDEDSGGIYISDPGGFLVSRQEFESLVEGIRVFFEHHGDARIDQINAEISDRRRQASREPQSAPETSTASSKRSAVPGYVYVIVAENGLYKIGKALNVSTRLHPFAVTFPMKWELVHTFRSANYSAAELYLHKKFAEKRDVGEWFRLSPDDVAYIQALQDFALPAAAQVGLDADHGNH